ncbi:hypothetical protein BJ684DRAFT_16960, partial [Piptocephalis cylindrospora]
LSHPSHILHGGIPIEEDLASELGRQSARNSMVSERSTEDPEEVYLGAARRRGKRKANAGARRRWSDMVEGDGAKGADDPKGGCLRCKGKRLIEPKKWPTMTDATQHGKQQRQLQEEKEIEKALSAIREMPGGAEGLGIIPSSGLTASSLGGQIRKGRSISHSPPPLRTQDMTSPRTLLRTLKPGDADSSDLSEAPYHQSRKRIQFPRGSKGKGGRGKGEVVEEGEMRKDDPAQPIPIIATPVLTEGMSPLGVPLTTSPPALSSTSTSMGAVFAGWEEPVGGIIGGGRGSKNPSSIHHPAQAQGERTARDALIAVAQRAVRLMPNGHGAKHRGLNDHANHRKGKEEGEREEEGEEEEEEGEEDTTMFAGGRRCSEATIRPTPIPAIPSLLVPFHRGSTMEEEDGEEEENGPSNGKEEPRTHRETQTSPASWIRQPSVPSPLHLLAQDASDQPSLEEGGMRRMRRTPYHLPPPPPPTGAPGHALHRVPSRTWSLPVDGGGSVRARICTATTSMHVLASAVSRPGSSLRAPRGVQEEEEGDEDASNPKLDQGGKGSSILLPLPAGTSPVRELCVRTTALKGRLSSAEPLQLNRRLRRAFDVRELAGLSDSILENVQEDIGVLGDRFAWMSRRRHHRRRHRGQSMPSRSGVGKGTRSSTGESTSTSSTHHTSQADGEESVSTGWTGEESDEGGEEGSEEETNLKVPTKDFIGMVEVAQELLLELADLRRTVNAYAVGYVSVVEERSREAVGEEYGGSELLCPMGMGGERQDGMGAGREEDARLVYCRQDENDREVGRRDRSMSLNPAISPATWSSSFPQHYGEGPRSGDQEGEGPSTKGMSSWWSGGGRNEGSGNGNGGRWMPHRLSTLFHRGE